MLQQSIRIPALLTLKLFNLKIRSTVKECKEQLWRCWIGNVRNYTGDFLQGFIHRFICENSCFRSLIMKREKAWGLFNRLTVLTLRLCCKLARYKLNIDWLIEKGSWTCTIQLQMFKSYSWQFFPESLLSGNTRLWTKTTEEKSP